MIKYVLIQIFVCIFSGSGFKFSTDWIGLAGLLVGLDWKTIVEEERGQRKAGKWDERMNLRYFESVLCWI